MFEKDAAKILMKTLKTLEIVVEGLEEKLEVPPEPKFGDLSFPCFDLAKQRQQPPQEVAQEIAEQAVIPDKSPFNRIASVGGYVNFFVDWENVSADQMKNILKDGEKFGRQKLQTKKKRIMVEFAHPNTHKAFHIGHLRNICIGESLSRILEFTGRKVVRTNYEGDIGPHVAKCLWGFTNLYNSRVPDGIQESKGEWLGKVYAEASGKIAENEKFEEEMKEINRKLYAGDKKIAKLWRMTKKWSLEEFDKIYKELGVKFDKLYFESATEERAIKLSKNLLKKGLAKLSEGAIIIDLSSYDLGVFLLLTKEGLPLYSAKDLALAEMEFKNFNIDKCVHVVGSEQKFYFHQLFKVFELIKSPAADKSHHFVYELVNLKTGKMSSRLGTVVLYTQLRDKMMEKVREEVKKRNPEMQKEEVEKTALAISLGAIKYGMLNIRPENQILFDWEEALQLEGDTGPYLQYAHTRCCGILRNAEAEGYKIDFKNNSNFSIDKMLTVEKLLVRKLLQFPETVLHATADLRPHYVCNYAYELATLFNNFYQQCPVLKAERDNDKSFRLLLVAATKVVLSNALNLMGVEALEKM